MSTRSNIAHLRKDGTVRAIYCHWDGYLEHNGYILKKHYNESNIEELLDLGDLSFLDASPLTCYAYGRDCGESDVQAKVYNSLGEYIIKYCDQDFNYLLKDGVWFYWNWDEAGEMKEVPNLKDLDKGLFND